jgi:hypothetical protein
MKLIDLPIGEARAVKWRQGRERYGPVFIGHPLEELHEELLDAMNYAEEAARRGFRWLHSRDLRQLCERTRAIYRAVEGVPQDAPGRQQPPDVEQPSRVRVACIGLYGTLTGKQEPSGGSSTRMDAGTAETTCEIWG